MSNKYIKKTWLIAFSTGGLATLMAIIFYHALQSYLLSQKVTLNIQETGRAVQSLYRRTLSFDVCNGMSNQRLSILYGIILAHELGRAAVIPNLVLSGMQTTNAQQLAEGNNSAPFSLLYNLDSFIEAVGAAGVEIISRKQAPPRELYIEVDLSQFQDPVEKLSQKFKRKNHLAIGCPLFRLHPYYLSGANYDLVWTVLNAFGMSSYVGNPVKKMMKTLRNSGPNHRYNFLHLRMENDWVEHCKRWETIPDGKIRNNCINNTRSIDNVLQNMGFDKSDPLYVATFWPEVSQEMYNTVMPRLQSAGYNIITSKYFRHVTDDREVNAMIDYEVAMQAHKFLGNSVSTFSALAIYQRRHNGLWASYYNTGNIPMSEFIPLEKLPWVFMYSSFTPDMDYLMKAAVESASHYKTLHPFCVFIGDESSDVYHWLSKHDVTLLRHDFKWKNELLDMMVHLQDLSQKSSSAFSSEILLSFMKVDVPLLPELEMFTYALVTDPDVFFHRKVSLQAFNLPLPTVLGMPLDNSDPSGLDSGVMLAHLPALRSSHSDLKLSILSNKEDLNFGKFGTGGSGAIAQFYELELRKSSLPSLFAAKPYENYDTGAYMVHFKDLKPVDYLAYYEDLTCRAGERKCKQAFKKGLCPYMKRWYNLLNDTENDVGLSLWYACVSIYAPHLQGLFLGGKTL